MNPVFVNAFNDELEKVAALTKREQRDLKSFERGAKYNPAVTGAVGAAAGAVAGPLVYGLAKGFGTGPGELLHSNIPRDAFGMPSVHKGSPTFRSIAKLWIRSPSGGLTIPAKAALIGAGILGTRTALGPSLSRRAAAKLRRKKAETSKTASAESLLANRPYDGKVTTTVRKKEPTRTYIREKSGKISTLVGGPPGMNSKDYAKFPLPDGKTIAIHNSLKKEFFSPKHKNINDQLKSMAPYAGTKVHMWSAADKK